MAQQGGGFGGGGFQGGFGGQQGTAQRQLDTAAHQIDQNIALYLNGPEIKNILTPGEYSEWKLTLKAGQVVIGEARSEAFDPALEIVDEKAKVLASNDDRYPGDQRPLLLWRCEKEGTYSVRVRCFHDKSGGQFFTRFRTYDTVDLSEGKVVDYEIATDKPFLFRVPMKAGQIKDVVEDLQRPKGFTRFVFNSVIFPSGIPEWSPTLSEPLSPAIRALVAPVSGDYYMMETPWRTESGKGLISVATRDIVPAKLVKEGLQLTGTAKTNLPTIWELPVKAGDFLEVSTPDLSLGCKLLFSEVPDFAKFDVTKPETNPFYPQEKPIGVNPEPAVDVLPARARDGRVAVFRARRDTTLWVSTDGAGPNNKTYNLRVKSAATEFVEGKSNLGKLRVGNSDYWAIEAKAGDVMSLATSATGFAQQITVRDPDLGEIRVTTAAPDQTSDTWQMIVQKPGRYLVAVSCLGDGGGGDYSLSRNVYHATDFNRSKPAKGEISAGQVQVWKFTAAPNDPMLVHWNSSNWNYTISIYNEKGESADFDRQTIDPNNLYGLLKVDQPRTYVIVLTGGAEKANYAIELSGIPGYSPGPAKGTKGK